VQRAFPCQDGSCRRYLQAVLYALPLISSPVRCETPRAPTAPPAQIPAPAELEARGAVIGAIRLRIINVFDLSLRKENNALFRLADRLHIKTRESAVRAQLLFKSGDHFSQRLIEETERNLRKLEYLFDANIRVIAYDGEHVDLEVVTRDVWTLQPNFSYRHSGGANTSAYSIEEKNLLGRGKQIEIEHSSTIDRTSTLGRWYDPNVGGSRWTDEVDYSLNNDGRNRQVIFERPFYSLDTRWSFSATALDNNRTDARYDLGQVVDRFRHDETDIYLFAGWSNGLVNGWTRRWLVGWSYEQQRFGDATGYAPPLVLPADRRLSYPWVGTEWSEDRYGTTINLNQIGRTEDLHYGRYLRFQLGWAAPSLGADRDALLLQATATQGFKFDETRSLFVNGDASGRLDSASLTGRRLTGAALDGGARYYWRWRPNRVFFMSLNGTTTARLDPENQILLGGDNGLRGYPLRYQSGTSRALMTVEQRLYTDWFPFRLFNVGGAIFCDAGRVWGHDSIGSQPLGWLRDWGFGLRLGNARSSFGNVLHIDLAFPLDADQNIRRMQFLVETKQSF
jgi:hypothetical protein